LKAILNEEAKRCAACSLIVNIQKRIFLDRWSDCPQKKFPTICILNRIPCHSQTSTAFQTLLLFVSSYRYNYSTFTVQFSSWYCWTCLKMPNY